MKLTITDDSQVYTISAYSEGEFTVRGEVLSGSHVIWPNKSPQPWQLKKISDLAQDSFDIIASENVETVILGTGKTLIFPDDHWLEHFYNQSVGIEIMDTAAACRTYNILVSEDRNILAALIPV